MKEELEIVSDGLSSVLEGGKFLRVSNETMYKLMGNGELCYVKIGRRRLIPKRALLEFAARNLKGGKHAD